MTHVPAVLFMLMAQPPEGDIAAFLTPDGSTRVIAHRGFSGEAPENTTAAFRRAIEVGADMIELDVLLSRDGELVVIHDDTLDRTTDGSGRVADHTLEELSRLDAGSWFAPEFAGERIPTLEEVLRLAHGRILVNIEIKTEAVTGEAEGGVVDKTLALVERLGMRDRIVISSFDPRALAHARALDPTIATASLRSSRHHAESSPAEVMESVGSQAFNLSRNEVSREVVEACHALGRPVAVYTVNEESEMRRLVELGVDALFTDHPDRLLHLLGRR